MKKKSWKRSFLFDGLEPISRSTAIMVSDEVKHDLLHGKADCIRGGKIHFNRMVVEKNEVSFWFNSKKVAYLSIPHSVNYAAGETLTVNFKSSMPVYLEDPV